ncbi:hypothetical protein C5167_016514 [Papaver somniferum]|nr:hypothetical protein C5167_016514 [Papaver somniferum]
MKLNEIKTSTNEMMLEEFFQGAQFDASEYKPFLSDDNNEEFSELKESAGRAFMALVDNTFVDAAGNDVKAIERQVIEREGFQKDPIEVEAKKAIKTERPLTLSQLHEDCFIPENLHDIILESPKQDRPTFSLGLEFTESIKKNEILVQQNQDELIQTSMDEEAKEMAGSQTSVDDGRPSKQLDRMSLKRKTIVLELQPRKYINKKVIAEVEKGTSLDGELKHRVKHQSMVKR